MNLMGCKLLPADFSLVATVQLMMLSHTRLVSMPEHAEEVVIDRLASCASIASCVIAPVATILSNACSHHLKASWRRLRGVLDASARRPGISWTCVGGVLDVVSYET